MVEFIHREYLWIVGATLAIISILQTWRINRLNRINSRRRNVSLYYKIKTNVTFEDIPENITICYKDEYFNRICFAEFILGNNGNVPLLKTDFNDTIRITTDKAIKILNYKILDDSNNKDKIILNLHKTPESDFIEASLNEILVKDSIHFYILFVPSNEQTNFNLKFIYHNECRLDSKTNRNVTYLDNPFYPIEDKSGWGFLMIIAYLAFIYYSFFFSQRYLQNFLQKLLNYTQVSSEIISFFFALLPAIFGTYFIYIALKKDIFRFNKNFDKRRFPFGRGFNKLK